MPEGVRAEMLAALDSVSHVVCFDDFLPIEFLAQTKPNFHCKAGDYDGDTLPEAAVVRANGGEVRILPIAAGFSTSQFIERVLQSVQGADPTVNSLASHVDATTRVIEQMLASANVLRQTAYQTGALVVTAGQRVSDALTAGGKILLCGNGGSAADAQHIAAEFVGRFKHDRRPLPAIALTTDTSILTAIGNDYGYDQVFARQVTALGDAGDILFCLSTSGNSPNVIMAARAARARGLFVIGLTGMRGTLLEQESDICLCVPSDDTPRVQQTHITMLHVICELTETQLAQERFLDA
jgi:D-sedoheptulose 7-phosphate isomerase